MKPLQVYFDEEEIRRLEEWSRERGWTKSQAVRAAVRALTRPADDDPLLAASGSIIDALPPDCAERFDEYLDRTFVSEGRLRYGRRPRARTRLRR